jgi:hypothetical protein
MWRLLQRNPFTVAAARPAAEHPWSQHHRPSAGQRPAATDPRCGCDHQVAILRRSPSFPSHSTLNIRHSTFQFSPSAGQRPAATQTLCGSDHQVAILRRPPSCPSHSTLNIRHSTFQFSPSAGQRPAATKDPIHRSGRSPSGRTTMAPPPPSLGRSATGRYTDPWWERPSGRDPSKLFIHSFTFHIRHSPFDILPYIPHSTFPFRVSPLLRSPLCPTVPPPKPRSSPPA